MSDDVEILPAKNRRDPRNELYLATFLDDRIKLYGTSPSNARQVAIEHFKPKKSYLSMLTVEPV